MSLRVLAAAVLAAAALAGCTETANRAACPAGKLCFETGNASDPVSLDPHKITAVPESRVVGDMLIGLMQNDASGKPVPGMATSWETSADGLVWTFHLRDAVWSDDVPVTAEDFAYAFRRIMTPSTAAEYASLLYFLKNGAAVNAGKMPPSALGVRAIDAHTLQLTLEHPAPYLLELAKHQTMAPVPKHVVEKWGDRWSDPAHFVSNGPYRLRSWTLQKSIILDKNPKFWEADKVCFDQVTFYPTEDVVSAGRQVLRGELDADTRAPAAYLREPDKYPGFVRTHTYLGMYYLFFNADAPKFKDVRVRQALSMAVDREFITNGISEGYGYTPAYTFVPPGVANYQPPAPPAWASWPLERRQAEARRLLAQAGYGPKNPLRVELKTSQLEATALTSSIQSDWAAIGVKGAIAGSEFQVVLQSYRMRDFDMGFTGWIADYNDAMAFLYLMDSGTGAMNYGGYANPRYDALLAAANNEADLKTREKILQQAESVMLNDYPVAPVYFASNLNLVNPRVTGWVDNIVDQHPTRYLCFKDAKR
jgi:oligopeptide transport system substrate-binding protein